MMTTAVKRFCVEQLLKNEQKLSAAQSLPGEASVLQINNNFAWSVEGETENNGQIAPSDYPLVFWLKCPNR